jgi:dolichol-phosphate mannosyltransferase
MLVSVIIPCKKEPYLDRLVSEIHNCLAYSHEILVQTEPGLAKAVLCGVERAKGDVLVVLDGDGSHEPQNLNTMVALVATYPVVVGSRYVNGGISKDSLIRQFLSRIFCRIASATLKLSIKDSMSGFVAIDRRVLTSVRLKPFGYKFVLDLLVKSNGGFKVFEYPIVFEARKMGYSKTGVRVAISTIALILLLWFWKTNHNY